MLKLWISALAAFWLLAGTGWTQSTPLPEPANMIPEGTRFIVTLDSKLDTSKLKQGQKFDVKLAEDLTAPDGSIIPRGKKIRGHVSEVRSGLNGRLLLSFTEVETRHGWVPLAATVTDVPGEKSIKTSESEGEISRTGSAGRRVVETAAVGAGVGAVAGAATAGMRGAAIGAAAGAAAGGGLGLLSGRDVVLQKGQQLELRLDRPVQVPR